MIINIVIKFTVAKEGGDLSLLEKLFKIGVNINALEKDEVRNDVYSWFTSDYMNV